MEQQPNKFKRRLKSSKTAKMFIVGFLSLILLIPLTFIENLIFERSNTQKNVVTEISKQWGNEIEIYGPIIKVPYKTYTKKYVSKKNSKQVDTELIENINYAYFFPEHLKVNSNVNPQIKKRGIYKSAVFESDFNVYGSFKHFKFEKIDVKEEDILWNRSIIILNTTNVKGVNSSLHILINDEKYDLSASSIKKRNLKGYYTLESSYIPLKKEIKGKGNLKFVLNFSIKGSKSIRFIPIGKETTANIKSNWKTANFVGEFLPYNSDKIKENGFDAKWKIIDINRPFKQEYFNEIPDLKEFDFGVIFKIPVDEYQKSMRSVKYGFLVISLTFLIFFLIQIISNINIHPFQYLMIGLSLVMFYTLLISISEHSNFLKAYSIATISVLLLITLYSISILKNIKFTVLIFLSLLVIYSFIFVIIQLESYALLVGSIGLFVILAVVMLVSRKIDWNN